MWVRFWHAYAQNYSGEKDRYYTEYQWLSDRETDESLKEWAAENVPGDIKYNVGYKYGFEKADKLPPETLNEMIVQCENQKLALDKYIEFLKGFLNG